MTAAFIAREVPQCDQYTGWRSRSGPAEQLVDRHAERLGLDVPQGELDARDRLGRDAARALAGHAVEVPVDALDGAGIVAGEDGLEVAHRARPRRRGCVRRSTHRSR